MWPSKWFCVVWGFLGFMVFISGVASGNVVTIIAGTVFTSLAVSAYLTSHVEGEHRVKRALEVVFCLMPLGLVVYGYVMTGSPVLGIITLFILFMFFFAFIVSYLLPRIRESKRRV